MNYFAFPALDPASRIEVLQSVNRGWESKRVISINNDLLLSKLIQLLCETFRLTPAQIMSTERKGPHSLKQARMMGYWIAYEIKMGSNKQIVQMFGRTDHSECVYGRQISQDRYDTDAIYRKQRDRILFIMRNFISSMC